MTCPTEADRTTGHIQRGGYSSLSPLGGNESDSSQSWALSVFFNFFNNKKWLFCIFYQVNNLFLHQSYLKSSLPVKLTLNCKRTFFNMEKNKKYRKCPALINSRLQSRSRDGLLVGSSLQFVSWRGGRARVSYGTHTRTHTHRGLAVVISVKYDKKIQCMALGEGLGERVK